MPTTEQCRGKSPSSGDPSDDEMTESDEDDPLTPSLLGIGECRRVLGVPRTEYRDIAGFLTFETDSEVQLTLSQRWYNRR